MHIFAFFSANGGNVMKMGFVSPEMVHIVDVPLILFLLPISMGYNLWTQIMFEINAKEYLSESYFKVYT